MCRSRIISIMNVGLYLIQGPTFLFQFLCFYTSICQNFKIIYNLKYALFNYFITFCPTSAFDCFFEIINRMVYSCFYELVLVDFRNYFCPLYLTLVFDGNKLVWRKVGISSDYCSCHRHYYGFIYFEPDSRF